MPSHFGWVDFANENQKKMMDVVKLFREKDTRDELGIGTIRDAFSDYFFSRDKYYSYQGKIYAFCTMDI